MSRQYGLFLVIAAAALWGTTGTAQSLAPASASSLSIGSARLLIGGIALLGISTWRGRGEIGNLLRRRATYLAALGMALYQPLFFSGLTKTGVAIGTTIAIGSAPILTGGLNAMVDGTFPGMRWVRSTALAVTGVAMLMISTATDASLDPLGAFMTLGAGASYALYAVSSRRLAPVAAPEHISGAVFSLAALPMVPLFVVSDTVWITSAGGMGVALWLGLAATALAYLLFTRGLRTVTAPAAATLSLAEPVTAAILALLLLNERLPALGTAGIVLVLIGLALMGSRASCEPS